MSNVSGYVYGVPSHAAKGLRVDFGSVVFMMTVVVGHCRGMFLVPVVPSNDGVLTYPGFYELFYEWGPTYQLCLCQGYDRAESVPKQVILSPLLNEGRTSFV